MHKKMRRSDRQLDDTAARAVLENGEYGVLATVDAAGQPYGVPVNYTVDGDTVFIHCALEGQKLENIAANPKVSFTVVGATELLPRKYSTKYESVVAFGTARVVPDEEKREPLRMLIRKYSPEFIEAGEPYIDKMFDVTSIIEITVSHMTGKARK